MKKLPDDGYLDPVAETRAIALVADWVAQLNSSLRNQSGNVSSSTDFSNEMTPKVSILHESTAVKYFLRA
ncbi:hypothetical protein [Nostoc sp. MS1]|uniref:hypothetical protein n=1 Tax=Nostoc sp. MS1 TaxID=2764711 RepID=UPI001CC8113C|nr:hypothetical protein [Nostoc sp. MS1]BCL34236.1 hypothetical protein NSMS1_06830 [Nostoc sp. MS1]